MAEPLLRCESPEVDGSAAWRLSLLFAVVLLAIMVLIYAYWATLFPGGTQSLPPAVAIPAAPRLQSSAPEWRQATQQQQSSQLESYGWVDRDTGIAHIPIERAMELRAGKQ